MLFEKLKALFGQSLSGSEKPHLQQDSSNLNREDIADLMKEIRSLRLEMASLRCTVTTVGSWCFQCCMTCVMD